MSQTEMLTFRASVEQVNEIDRRATRLGMTRTEYVLQCACFPSDDVVRTLRAFRKLTKAADAIRQVLSDVSLKVRTL